MIVLSPASAAALVAIDEVLVPIGMSSLSVVVALLSSGLAMLMSKRHDMATLGPVLFGVWLWGAIGAPAAASWAGWHAGAGIVMAFAGAFVVPMLILDTWGTVNRLLNTLARVFPWIKPENPE